LGNIARYRITSIDVPVPGTKILRLEPIKGPIAEFKPGQWVFLHLLDSKGAGVDKRPYSIASAPSAPYLEFCIEMRNGPFTGKLDKVAVGSVLGVEGPEGRMTYEGEKKAAFMAGGCGIAPVLGILRYIAEKRISGEFVLFYSVRSKDRLVYGEELERLKKMNPCIKTVITLTRETPDKWIGECGRINYEMIARYAGKPAKFGWWMCGPVEMVKSMRECLAGMGVDEKEIHMEAWG
jgi:ferredoxin-NADP reductase